MESIFFLNDALDTATFYGVNNINILCLKNQHPDVRVVARGYQVKIIGSQPAITRFEQNLRKCEEFCIKVDAIGGVTDVGQGATNVQAPLVVLGGLEAVGEAEENVGKAVETTGAVVILGRVLGDLDALIVHPTEHVSAHVGVSDGHGVFLPALRRIGGGLAVSEFVFHTMLLPPQMRLAFQSWNPHALSLYHIDCILQQKNNKKCKYL